MSFFLIYNLYSIFSSCYFYIFLIPRMNNCVIERKKIGHLQIMQVRQAALCVFSPDLFSVLTMYNVYSLPIQIL